MKNFKSDFPVFSQKPELVYLDNTATTQKPAYVIDGVAQYLRTGYANIHRGAYELSEISEKFYEDSKKIVAKHLGVENWREIIYTSNSTYAMNLLAQSLRRGGLLQSGDTVLVSVVEHHANVVPWLILKEDFGIQVEFVKLDENFDLDYEDLKSKLTPKVKVVSLAQVSNTTGQIFDIAKVREILEEMYTPLNPPYQGEVNSSPYQGRLGGVKPLLVVDASQSVPHFSVHVQELGCDALVFTGHKIFADSGIGVLWAKEELLKTMKPAFSGGGAIGFVKQDHFTHSSQLPDAYEPGTPNLTGAVSLLKAFEYIEHIGGYEVLEHHERDLVEYTLERFEKLSVIPANAGISKGDIKNQSEAKRDSATSAEGQDLNVEWFNTVLKGAIKLIGTTSSQNRVGVFSFVVDGIHSHDIAEYLAEHHICIRAGQHCAEPFMDFVGQKHSCRMSVHLYNTREDIDRFFEILEMAINELR